MQTRLFHPARARLLPSRSARSRSRSDQSFTWLALTALLLGAPALPACRATASSDDRIAASGAIRAYRADRTASLRNAAAPAKPPLALTHNPAADSDPLARHETPSFQPASLLLASPIAALDAPQSQPASDRDPGAAGAEVAYAWKHDVWRQASSEMKRFAGREFWLGFKRSFWRLDNALFLAGAMGASIAIRETGVDDTVRARVRGHQQFGDLDETMQIIGNPGTHFAAAGVAWLGSTLLEDVHGHEFAKTLIEALAVNGVTTTVLKVSANTRAPDGDSLAWPSGHTSSAFTVAAVANEYYGPLVGIPSFALATLVGYQRIDSRVHDLSDVVFGAALGYVVGTSIAREDRAALPEIFGMKVLPYSDPQTGAAGLALWGQIR
ncbi:MAG: hypothetical protein CHACPFDD_03854 [Phycisphaerae bacterium]|nr:hypothetical protein [Phycisphaerae bacterium]